MPGWQWVPGVENDLEDLPSDEDSPSEKADAHAREVLARFANLPELPVSKNSEDESPSDEDFLTGTHLPRKIILSQTIACP